jgi:hypothetical protein
MCDRNFQHGTHRYGKYIKIYNIMVCTKCYEGNRDGWGPDCEKKLINYLTKEGKEIPERNKEGWLPRD